MFYLFRFIFLLVLFFFSMVIYGSAQELAATDKWLEQPVSDNIFLTYLDFFAYDRNIVFDLQVIDLEENEGIRKEHLSFQSTPGVRVYANHYFAVASDAQMRPAIILLHGGVSNGKDSRAPKSLASLLARDGWNVLAIDMQYFGERTTDLLSRFTENEKHEKLYNRKSIYLAWVIQTVKDVSRSFDLLVEERNADPKRICLLGFSRGAQVGTIVGGAEPRFSAVVLLHGGHFDALEREHMPAACPANYIGRISPRPLLMINGNYDTDYVKDTSVLPLQRLAGSPKLIRWADTGHAIITNEDRSLMLKWLRENLK